MKGFLITLAIFIGIFAGGLTWRQQKDRAGRAESEAVEIEALRTRKNLEAMSNGEAFATACKVCGGQLSSKAEKCPHCGDPR